MTRQTRLSTYTDGEDGTDDIRVIRRSIREVLADPHPGEYRVMTTRYYPRWIGKPVEATPYHRRDPELSPSRDLMAQYDDDGPFRPWAEAFVEEVGEDTIVNRIETYKAEAAAAGKDTVVLSCYEPSSDPRCHVEALLSVYRGEWAD